MSSDWRTAQLGKCIELTTGYPFKSVDYVDEGIRLLRGDNVAQGVIRWDGAKHLPLEKTKNLEDYALKPGDVVLAMDRPWITAGLKFSTVRSSDLPCLLVQRVARIRPIIGIDAAFLHCVIASTSFSQYIQNVTTGTAVPHISAKQIRDYEFNLPDLDSQRAIGEIVMTLDDRITLLRETNATLEAIAQALFKSWFVDFDPVRAKMEGRAPEGMDEATAALFPDGFEESELGRLPIGWTCSSLAEACSYLNRGLSPKYIDEGGVLVLNQKCVRDFSVDYTKGRRHDSAQRKIDGRALAVGDVLVNSTGVGTLGRVAQVLALPEPAIVDSHVTVVRAGSRLSWPYLGQWLAKVQPEIEAMGEGSTGQTELSRTKLGAMMILVPPRDVLTAFDAIVEPLKARVALNDAGANNLTAIRDRLLPRLISGQVKI